MKYQVISKTETDKLDNYGNQRYCLKLRQGDKVLTYYVFQSLAAKVEAGNEYEFTFNNKDGKNYLGGIVEEAVKPENIKADASSEVLIELNLINRKLDEIKEILGSSKLNELLRVGM